MLSLLPIVKLIILRARDVAVRSSHRGWLDISPRRFSPGIFDRAGRSSSPPAAAFVFTALSTNDFASCAIGEGIMPKEKNCLIVRAAGRQLDLLRGEASRIAKGSNVDWWIDQAEVGTRFCFENTKAKRVIRSRL